MASATKRRSRQGRGPLRVRGVRGATTAAADTPEAIEEAVHELLAAMVDANRLDADDLAAVFFSVTDDLHSAFPASAARSFGWRHVPLLDVREAEGDGDLARCIRVLALWNTRLGAGEIRHVYLRQAASLRPDLCAAALAVPGGWA
ncbi:MAG: chorismate mutase [Firmicutes bacterium]|nr:chorismate mutase [Bacillota bacterium]